MMKRLLKKENIRILTRSSSGIKKEEIKENLLLRKRKRGRLTKNFEKIQEDPETIFLDKFSQSEIFTQNETIPNTRTPVLTHIVNNRLIDVCNVNENVNKKVLTNEPPRLPCSICLEPLKQPGRLDPCGHEFCKECIDQWAALSNQCPLCKEDFRKVFYWEADQKVERKVRKRKFKFEDEEVEPWLQNCAENCMVCNKANDEHLLLVCDKCTYNICHTYCAGLDLIPDEEWICSTCSRRGGRNINNISLNESTPLAKKRSRIIDDEVNITLTRSKSKTNSTSKKEEKSYKNVKNSNINIPISCKWRNNEIKSNLKLNLNLNLQITNKEEKQVKTRTKFHLRKHSLERKAKAKNYNLRKNK